MKGLGHAADLVCSSRFVLLGIGGSGPAIHVMVASYDTVGLKRERWYRQRSFYFEHNVVHREVVKNILFMSLGEGMAAQTVKEGMEFQ
jgi:hypothetical protein